MLSGEQQMPMSALNQVNPIQAHKGIGGFAGDAWNAIMGGLRAATDWVRGGLAAAAGLILNPIKDGLGALLPSTGIGDIAKRASGKAIESALAWIAGKDAADIAAGRGSYSGQLGSFFRPAGGAITSGFGASRGRYPHAGIDYAVPIGSPVRAMFDGVVQKTGWNVVAGRSGLGQVLAHGDGMGSYYGHLSGIVAKAGQKVKAGQVIARSGNTGRSTGPHLHAELWRNGQPFNYGSYLYDNGGVLPTGRTVIQNNTGKPEAILNPQQWKDVHKLASAGAGTVAAGGRAVNFYGNVGFQPEDLVDVMDRRERRQRIIEGVAF